MEIQYTHEIFGVYSVRIFANFPIHIIDINSARKLLTKEEFLAIVSKDEKDLYQEKTYFQILDFISDRVKECEEDKYLNVVTALSSFNGGIKMIGKDFKRFSRKLGYDYVYFEKFPIRPFFRNTFGEKIGSSPEEERKIIKAMFEDIIDRRNILIRDRCNAITFGGNDKECLCNKMISTIYLTLKRGLLD